MGRFSGVFLAFGKPRWGPAFPSASSPTPTSQGVIQRAPGWLDSERQNFPGPFLRGSAPRAAGMPPVAAPLGEPSSSARLREGADPGAAALSSGAAPRAAPSPRARFLGGSLPGAATTPSGAAHWGESASPARLRGAAAQDATAIPSGAGPGPGPPPPLPSVRCVPGARTPRPLPFLPGQPLGSCPLPPLPSDRVPAVMGLWAAGH